MNKEENKEDVLMKNEIKLAEAVMLVRKLKTVLEQEDASF